MFFSRNFRPIEKYDVHKFNSRKSSNHIKKSNASKNYPMLKYLDSQITQLKYIWIHTTHEQDRLQTHVAIVSLQPT